MEDKTQISYPSSSMSLVSRLDYLDFLMKFLERKQNLAKLESDYNAGGEQLKKKKKKKQCMPVDLALKETCFKGSLMDRVAALENRLFQLCLDKETSSSSSTSTNASSGETYSSCHGLRGESSCSLPTFTANIRNIVNNNQLPQLHTATRLKIQEEGDREDDPKQNETSGSSAQQKQRKKKATKANKDQKSLKPEKKRMPLISWPHLKILGC